MDLPALKASIDALAEQVRVAKASGSDDDKARLPGLVKEMLEGKKKYAEANGGIGIDGKPYEEPMSKSQKKKKEKAEKAAKAAAEAKAAGGGDANVPADPNSKGSLKKAAKKAEKAAKKAAAKAAAKGGAGGGAAPDSSKGAVPPAGKKVAAAAKKPAAAARSPRPARPSAIPTKSRVQPHALAFDPNSDLDQRPVVALAVAALTNTSADFAVVGDHTRQAGPGMGMPKGSGGGEIVGDAAIARYVARRAEANRSCQVGGVLGSDLLGGADPALAAAVDQWVDYAQSLSRFGLARRIRAAAATLGGALAHRTYAVGHSLTLADLALFAALGFPSHSAGKKAVLDVLGDDEATKTSPVWRWIGTVASHPAVREATALAVGVQMVGPGVAAEPAFGAGQELEPLVKGMSTLAGATPGMVVTRFPPEPSGYLHVGHAKAVLMNEYYARRYNGRLIVRFDDTNPSKEKAEFQAAILEDLGQLGVKPDVVTFTSDYFETIRGYALYLIENGMAFMDDTPQDVMQKERMDRTNSNHRDQSPAEALEMFNLMCSGSEEGSKWCLRARIDMGSVNGTMRDPVMYRQNTTPHHRSGTKYKAYPTYDLACPIVDSIEGVTHALRTTEYNDRDEQYAWIQRALGLRRTRIHAFARMNFVNTELSKRKLAWFVENGHVTGWDDPRFPTVRGIVRRGLDVSALRAFMLGQGASRRIVNMEWGKFWAENKKEVDKYSARYMAIDATEKVGLTVTNGPEASENVYLSTNLHPKDPAMGSRLLRLAKKVFLEKVDAADLEVGQNIVLMRWGVVKITGKGDDGALIGEHDPDGDLKAAKPKLSWLPDVPENIPVVLSEFDNLISKDKLDEGDDFKDFINPDTLAETQAIGDVGLRNLKQHEIIQLERRGYFRVDKPYLGPGSPLILFTVPDGRSKAMGGTAGKLKHS